MKEKPTPEGPLELQREGDSEADEDEEDVDTGSINEAMEDTNNNVEQQENNLADEDDAAAAADLNAAAVELSSPVDGDDIEENVHVAEADAEAEDGNAKLPAATENEKLHDESLENVSDISASSSNEEDMADGWMAPATGSPTLGDDEGMGMDFGVTDPSSSSNMPRNRSFTICSVITNTSEHGSTRSQRRENVDRLLMSGSGPMSVGSMGRRPSRCSLGGSSLAGSDMSPMQQPRGLERPNVAYTYDPNYYKSPGDWLRFVPRRSSNDVRSSQASSSGDPPSITDSNLSPHHMNNHVYGHGGSPGYSIATGHPVNPDLYYRGFDNTRVRFGTNYRYPGVSANNAPTSRVRGDLGHHRHHHHQSAGVARFQDGAAANNMLGPNGEVFDTPSMGDANINLNQTMGPPAVGDSLGRGYVQQYSAPGMYPNMISVPIDEEEGGTFLETSEHNLSRKEATSPPLEIHCAPNEEAEVFDENILNHHLEDDSALKHHAMNPQLVGDVQDVERQHGGAVIPSAVPNQDQPSHPATLSRTNCSPPPPSFEAGMRFDSSLRIGGIIPPSRSNSNRGTNTTHSHPLPPHLLEQKMHEASWDSKYETYACRVDQRQEDRSVEIPIFSMTRPHMRSFHCAWLAFFFAFLAWFAITPLLGEVQKSLGLSKEQIWTTNICSVAGAVVTRCVAGLFCDIYGARWMSAAVLFICGIPTIFTGAVNTVEGLSILRLVTGIGGSAFVTCQYWTSTMFTKEVAGTANALAAGWGNLGGGVAQIFVGSMLFPLFKLIYNAAGTERDPAELSWRTCCVIPGLMCTAFTFVVIRYSDDSPKGNYTKRKHLGLMQKQSAMTHIKAAIHDHNTWLLLIQYGCCFGVELTTSNAAALYFKEEFELSTEAAAAVASTFGWMNLFARGLGGFLSDISNAYRGMRGRLTWQLLCFLLEGVFVMVFSKANTLGGAITALMTFSLFVQGAEGSTFGIVPYLNPNVTGTVAGIVGAGGNAGAVIFSIMFRQMDYRDAFFWMGASTSIVSVLSSFVWIKGYEGLFFQRRVTPTPAPQQQQLEKVDENNSKPPNTSSELQAGAEEGAQNHSRSYIETDPPSSISGPLSH